jgi:RNA polymerase sigma-70 factor (ECF subfamily)
MKQEKQLISDYLKGDQKAFEALVSLYLRPVFGFVLRFLGNRQEAEDITQETFLRAWKNFKKSIFNQKGFDPKRGSFKTWIFSIARNAAIDWLKKKKIPVFSQFGDEKGEIKVLDLIPDNSPLPDEISQQKDISDLVENALKKISPQSRMVLYLYYNDHMNFREIAEVLAESVDTIKSRHRRALIALQKILKNESRL